MVLQIRLQPTQPSAWLKEVRRRENDIEKRTEFFYMECSAIRLTTANACKNERTSEKKNTENKSLVHTKWHYKKLRVA